MPKLATKKDCTGCLACVDSCNVEAISMSLFKDGFQYPLVDDKKCIECKQCEKSCPIVSPVLNLNKLDDAMPWASWSNNDEPRLKSTSGGVFAELAGSFITHLGGVVIGAALINNNVKHIPIESISDIEQLQGSKYIQSDTTGIYLYTRNTLENNRKVMFTGTPCQIAGLYAFLRDRDVSNLLTVEVICLGVPSMLIFSYYINKNEVDKVISFRDKSNGWISGSAAITYINKDKIKIRDSAAKGNFFVHSFGRNLCLRESCYDCRFSSIPRRADIALGDYWGVKKWTEQYDKGISLVITSSHKGKNLFLHNNDLTIYETNWNDCLAKNPRIYTGVNLHRIVSHNNRIHFILKNFNYPTAYKLLTCFFSNSNFIWLPYKFIIKFVGMMNKIKNKKTLKNVMKSLLIH